MGFLKKSFKSYLQKSNRIGLVPNSNLRHFYVVDNTTCGLKTSSLLLIQLCFLKYFDGAPTCYYVDTKRHLEHARKRHTMRQKEGLPHQRLAVKTERPKQREEGFPSLDCKCHKVSDKRSQLRIRDKTQKVLKYPSSAFVDLL